MDAQAQKSTFSLRRLLIRPPYAEPVDLSGKHMIVTGASPGSIGEATARTLAAWGACVVITARTRPDQSADAIRRSLAPDSAGRVIPASLDLSDRASVASFVDWYRGTQSGQLDVLINNAGIHLDLLSRWKAPRLSADEHELHWRTNYLGSFDLSHQLLPLLLERAAATGDARVVNVVSQLHRRGSNAGLAQTHDPYSSWVAYGLSKLALVHMSFELQRRYGTQGLNAYCVHPGAVYSRIADKGLAGADTLTAIRKWLAPMERFFMLTPAEGAQTSLYCATDPNARGGTYNRRCRPAPASQEANDQAVASQLWADTLAWLEA